MSKLTERQILVLRYRRYGHSVQAISEMLSVTTGSVNSSLASAYKNLHQHHEAEKARDLELIRLDEIQEAYYERAIGKETTENAETGEQFTLPPDEKAADVVFKAMDRRAKLMGLDAPEKKEVDTNLTIGWLGGGDEHTGSSTIVGDYSPVISGGGGEDSCNDSYKKIKFKEIVVDQRRLELMFCGD